MTITITEQHLDAAIAAVQARQQREQERVEGKGGDPPPVHSQTCLLAQAFGGPKVVHHSQIHCVSTLDPEGVIHHHMIEPRPWLAEAVNFFDRACQMPESRKGPYYTKIRGLLPITITTQES